MTTLNNHVSGPSWSIMLDLASACKKIASKLREGALSNNLGDIQSTNTSGDVVKKMDVIAHEIIASELKSNIFCYGMASEEAEDIMVFNNQAEFFVAIDPLDGSSNIDVNIPVGTIFSVYSHFKGVGASKGYGQIAAGYVIYGPSTMLVYTEGNGVNGFTLSEDGRFYLTHPNIKYPEKTTIYSVNQGNYNEFTKHIQRRLDTYQTIYTHRYVGSLVADFHRNLLKGGIFLYPATNLSPDGKLRLLYECNPLAFISEQAGGSATDGYERILNKVQSHIHQKTQFFVGPTETI